MKPFLAIVAGFMASLGMFAIGAFVATSMMTAEPERGPDPGQAVAELWTSQPRQVRPASQPLERVPSQMEERGADVATVASPETIASPETVASPEDADIDPIDTLETASTPAASEDAALSEELYVNHIAWCESRYRSYRSGDNSYTSFGGMQKPCVSPYLLQLADQSRDDPATYVELSGEATAQFVAEDAAPVEAIAAEEVNWSAGLGSDHIQDCFNRYRSYRPEDNSYQPFGGGPRRQCE